jgi:hypothetical protein
MATSVPDWLDSVKAGYGNKFALCFEDIGVEDVADVPDIHINNKALMELEESLRKAGAKTIHVAKITAAIAELAGKGSGGMAPTRPAIPASSSRSPHHAVKNTAAPDKQYACFLSHHKAACAMEARFLKEKLEALMNKEVFLDSDDLKVRLVALHSAQPNVFLTRLSSCFARPPQDLRKLLDHVRASSALVILQSAEVLHRPWCLLEMHAAIEAGIPIIAVAVSGRGYDFATATNLLLHLDSRLEVVNPGASDMLLNEGVDLLDVAFKISSVLPNIISLPFNSSSSDRFLQAAILDIVDAVQDAAALPIPTGRDAWLTRRGTAPATSKPQHGDGMPPSDSSAAAAPQNAAVAPAPAAVTGGLATVPLAVPDLPDVLSERHDVASSIRASLIGKDTSTSVSISSTNKQTSAASGARGSKVAAHGQGGVGKTIMAVLTVNDPAVRAAFDRIGWVSVGQTPAVMEMQRMLFRQLTEDGMVVKGDATTESQLKELQAACESKRWLVVLDDVWDRAHEKQLNCIDPSSPSKLLVTTRIRGLVQGCDEVSLNLLTASESVDLFLRTGQVEDADEAARAAASEIAELCGNLPLYLSICGGIMLDYDGGPEWQAELVGMLKDDRVGVIDDGSGGNMAERLVDSSLSMLKDEQTSLIFMALGVCPEDVQVALPVAQLICGADAEVVAKGKVNAILMRRSVKTLLDRSLLQGSMSSGVCMHDLVRDIVRFRLGGADGVCEKQRGVVQAFAAVCPAEGWASDDAIGQYAAQALQLHMCEALLPDPLNDTEALEWMDASDDVLTHPFVRCAANALGHAILIEIGEKLEEEGKHWEAAKVLASAAGTDALSAGGQASAAEALANNEVGAASLMIRACGLLVLAEQSNSTRAMEIAMRGMMMMRLPWQHEFNAAGMARVAELAAAGVTLTSPAMQLSVGMGCFAVMEEVGCTLGGEFNTHDPEAALRCIKGWYSEDWFEADESLAFSDPYRIVTMVTRFMGGSCHASHRQHEEGRLIQARFVPHSLGVWLVDAYDWKRDSPRLVASPMGSDSIFYGAVVTFALTVYGDVALARKWMHKICDVWEAADPRTNPDMFMVTSFGGLNLTHAYMRNAGLSELCLRLLKAAHFAFSEADATAAVYHAVNSLLAWEGKEHCYMQQSSFASQARRRHWMLAPGEVGKDAMSAWLKQVPAEWGSSGQGDLIDSTPISIGMLCGGKFHAHTPCLV